ncbi:MAG: NUMOD3 domain-containing DNA-binding protein [Methanothrix sp.]
MGKTKNSSGYIKMWQDPAYRAHMSEVRRELWQDPEYKEMMSNSHRGNQNRTGIKHTEEDKKRISDTLKGHPAYEKQRESVRNMNKNRIISESTRKKISDWHKGRPITPKGSHLSEEHRRRLSETRILRGVAKGDKNPAWRGGTSFKPYCYKFDEALKEEVRARFGRKCYLCPTTENENGRRLTCHHVDYNKSQGCKGLKWSLLPLCDPCHGKTNHNRWYWFALLRDYWIYEYIEFNSGDINGFV